MSQALAKGAKHEVLKTLIKTKVSPMGRHEDPATISGARGEV